MTSSDGMVVCSLKGSGFGLKLRFLCAVRMFSFACVHFLWVCWFPENIEVRLILGYELTPCALCVLFDGTPVWLGAFLPLCRPRSLLRLQPWRKSVLATFTSTIFFWTDWKENQIIYQTSQKLLYSIYNQLPQGEIIVYCCLLKSLSQTLYWCHYKNNKCSSHKNLTFPLSQPPSTGVYKHSFSICYNICIMHSWTQRSWVRI